MRDIALGLDVVAALGAFDIGQAAVVARGYVLGVEAAEGTDALLKRCADLNRWGFSGRKGVLVKAPKPGQDQRFDMPTVGPRTVELAAEAGLEGIAVAAGAVLLADQVELVEKADKLGLFLYGVRLPETRQTYAAYSRSPAKEA
jgi:UDP-2,3-diacylglucosamine hydrolase